MYTISIICSLYGRKRRKKAIHVKNTQKIQNTCLQFGYSSVQEYKHVLPPFAKLEVKSKLRRLKRHYE